MKILHLPTNIASQISCSVRALRSIGVDARGLARTSADIQDHHGIEVAEPNDKPNPLSKLARSISWRLKLLRAMAWADVVHWHWGNSTCKGFDLRLAARLGRPRLVEFWGDDIRLPEIASRDNPYIAGMYGAHPELMPEWTPAAQAVFSGHGFECLIPGHELGDYVDRRHFPTHHQTMARLLLEEYKPSPPSPTRRRPLVVHAPSNKLRKGTEAVLAHVQRLARDHEFDFRLIHNMPRREAMRTVSECDIFLDQFTIGAEGLASLEAMAWGKPVVCYIKPAWLSRYPADLPIVVADQSTLGQALADLLIDGQRRHDLGIRGRHYVETHHDARRIASHLASIYQDMLRRHAGAVRKR